MGISLLSVTLSAGIVAYTLATIGDQARRISEFEQRTNASIADHNDRVDVLAVRVTNYTEAVKVRGCFE